MFVGVSMPMSLRAIQHRWPAGKASANGSAFQPEVNDSLIGTETVDLVSDLAGLAFYKDRSPILGISANWLGRNAPSSKKRAPHMGNRYAVLYAARRDGCRFRISLLCA
jgi:hypothetical protein